MKWFLESNGGQNGSTTALLLGNVIHKFAELAETEPKPVEEQLEMLRRNWELVNPEKGWMSKTESGRAILMLKRFFQYREGVKDRIFHAAEARFEIDLGIAKVRGSIDRVEIDANGDFYLIDFKTGTNHLTAAEGQSNAQMQLYQLAISDGDFGDRNIDGRSSGAALLYLQSTNKEPKLVIQDPIDPEVVRERVRAVAVKMGGSTYLAKVNKNCERCVVRFSCPLMVEGGGLFD